MRLVKFVKAPYRTDWCVTEGETYEVPTLNKEVILRTPGSFSQTWISLGRFKEYLQKGIVVFVD